MQESVDGDDMDQYCCFFIIVIILVVMSWGIMVLWVIDGGYRGLQMREMTGVPRLVGWSCRERDKVCLSLHSMKGIGLDTLCI